MKTLLFFTLSIFLVSCSKTLYIENHTGREIQSLSFLSKEDVTNYNLDYDEVKNKNILDENLLPKDKLSFDAKNMELPYCMFFEDTDYHSYLYFRPTGEIVQLSSRHLSSYKPLNSTIYEPTDVVINVNNTSDYFIQYVIINSNDWPETYQVLNPWNIINPGEKKKLVFSGFEKESTINSIQLIGVKNGRKMTLEYTDNLEEELVFRGRK